MQVDSVGDGDESADTRYVNTETPKPPAHFARLDLHLVASSLDF